MPEVTVVKIVDGDTFEVSPNWNLNGESGSRVRPTGYDAPEMKSPGGPAAKRKLAGLILNQKVALKNYHRIDHGRLVCDVFFKGRNLASYFT